MLFVLPAYLLRQTLLISSFPLVSFVHSLTKIQFSDTMWHDLNTKGKTISMPQIHLPYGLELSVVKCRLIEI